MKNKISFVFLLFQVTLIAAELPKLNICEASDSKCLTALIQVVLPYLAPGVPELGTEPLDVMSVDYINVNLGGLKLEMSELRIKGVKDAVIDSANLDMEKKILEFTITTNISFKCKYKASGKLLVLPISGDGILSSKLNQIEVTMIVPFKLEKTQNEKRIMKLLSFKLKFDVKENASFHLTNLFNGNKYASDVIHKFMNENWQLVTREFGEALLLKPYTVIFNSVKAFLLAQPLENLIKLP